MFALQVWQPSTYQSVNDADQLLTVFLAYIPSDKVDTLAQQITDKNSQFYTGAGPPYTDLALHVNAAFPVQAVTSPTTGDGSTSPDSTASGASSSSSKTRENVIIGVVTSLGAITLIVLAFLVIRAVKQRREMAHRRLSDPPTQFVGSRPENQDFDRDSVGGARRRSFYYAEDSLRGFEGSSGGAGGSGGAGAGAASGGGASGAGAASSGDGHYDHVLSEQQQQQAGMRERRPVNAGMISTPILRDNTMNW